MLKNNLIMPVVSAVIPGYNHGPYLKQRIDSVLEQTFEDIEVIILDDCSTDNSRKIIETYHNYPKVTQICYNEINSNSTFSQWAKGVNLCSSEVVWIAESDDFADKDFLSFLVPKILTDERIGIAYCQSLKVNEYNQVTGNWKSYTDDLDTTLFENDFSMFGPDYIRDFLIHKNTIPNASSVIFKKKYYDAAGGAEREIKNCSDWLTWLKILMFSDICFIAKPLNYFRYHNNSVIAKAVRQFDPGKYREKYDRTMRARFKIYLEDMFSNYPSIINANDNYIQKEDWDERLFSTNNK
jgi:glycosyltransferase involved in cell wall biosynthesis